MEEIYMKLPFGMSMMTSVEVCKLQHCLYGLKHAHRIWFERFRCTLLTFFFHTVNIITLPLQDNHWYDLSFSLC